MATRTKKEKRPRVFYVNGVNFYSADQARRFASDALAAADRFEAKLAAYDAAHPAEAWCTCSASINCDGQCDRCSLPIREPVSEEVAS